MYSIAVLTLPRQSLGIGLSAEVQEAGNPVDEIMQISPCLAMLSPRICDRFGHKFVCCATAAPEFGREDEL
jgi:hypothetical protein